LSKKTTPNSPTKPEKHWINRKNVIALLQITGQSFDAWKVQPKGKFGREIFFDLSEVIANRVAHKEAQIKIKYGAVADTEDQGLKLNPIDEQAKLNREKRIGQQLANDQKMGNVFPIVAAEYVFSRMGAEIAAILESLPAKIKRTMPKMTATTVNEIKKEIAKARNSAVSVNEKFDEFLEDHYNSTE